MITANRPFLSILRDQPTGAIVFMGQLMDPTAQ
jgi:serine protease inhibitor